MKAEISGELQINSLKKSICNRGQPTFDLAFEIIPPKTALLMNVPSGTLGFLILTYCEPPIEPFTIRISGSQDAGPNTRWRVIIATPTDVIVDQIAQGDVRDLFSSGDYIRTNAQILYVVTGKVRDDGSLERYGQQRRGYERGEQSNPRPRNANLYANIKHEDGNRAGSGDRTDLEVKINWSLRYKP